MKLKTKVQDSLFTMLKDMSIHDLREVSDFVSFLRTRSQIDPAQAYFWTTRWQAMENRVQADKQARRILGDGNIDSLLSVLKK